MKLTNRLQKIADLIEKNTIVGDIGSDHGYLVTDLVVSKKVPRAIASDINQGPVNNCKQTVKENGLEDLIEVRLGGGFVPYEPGEIQTAVIAGMGGELIRDIFLESPEVVKATETFLLQAMTGQEVLRAWLLDNHFTIEQEWIAVEQDRFYEIMVVKHGDSRVVLEPEMAHLELDDPLIMEIGYKMVMDNNYIGFIEKKIQKYKTIGENLSKNAGEDHPKLVVVRKNIENLKEVLACIQTQKK